MSNQKDSALAIFDAGYAPFPCAANTKTPLVKWTVDYATSQDQVVDWWTDWPEDNIGINCQESNLLAVDLDGVDAARAFARLWTAMESKHPNYYGTPIIQTPHGWHYYYDLPDPPLHNTKSSLMPGVDTRAAGGMVVGPGSVIDGVPYQLVSGDLTRTRPVPGWLIGRLREFEKTVSSPVSLDGEAWPEALARLRVDQKCGELRRTPEGRRNVKLYKVAFALRPARAALGPEVVRALLTDAALETDLSESAINDTITSAWKPLAVASSRPFLG